MTPRVQFRVLRLEGDAQSGDDGLAREHWGVADQLALMQQLGAIPAGAPA